MSTESRTWTTFNAVDKQKRAGRIPARPRGANCCCRDYGVVFVPVYGATPGVQPLAPGGQTGTPPTGPMATPPSRFAELTPTAPEQPLPSHAASKSTPKRPAAVPALVIETMTQFCDARTIVGWRAKLAGPAVVPLFRFMYIQPSISPG